MPLPLIEGSITTWMAACHRTEGPEMSFKTSSSNSWEKTLPGKSHFGKQRSGLSSGDRIGKHSLMRGQYCALNVGSLSEPAS